MEINSKKCMYVLLMLLFSCHALAATYSYEGGLFQTINGSNYDTSMRVTASFETSDPLDANLAAGDISSLLIDFSFNDGVQTISLDDAEIVSFNVSTNAQGVPDTWSITVWRAPVTNTVGETVDGIDLVFLVDAVNGNSATEQGFSEPCGASGVEYCGFVALNSNSGGFFDTEAPGTWAVSGLPVQAVQSVPVNNLVALLMLSVLLLMVVWFQKFRKQTDSE